MSAPRGATILIQAAKEVSSTREQALAAHCSRLSHGRDDMGPDFATHWSRPKLLSDCGCRNVRCFRQTIRIASLDLIPHRRALAVSNRY
jgi:hypothetical protein